jgi:hypothetical protein
MLSIFVSSKEGSCLLIFGNVSKLLTTETTESFRIVSGLLSKLQIDLELQAPSSASTLFLPVDAAFKKVSSKLHSLSIDQTYIFIKAHIARGYFTPALLRAKKNHTLSTLSTEAMGKSKYLSTQHFILLFLLICTDNN